MERGGNVIHESTSTGAQTPDNCSTGTQKTIDNGWSWPRELPDGEYDTCSRWGPYVYQPHRRVRVTDNIVRLINPEPRSDNATPDWLKGKTWAFTVSDFFKVNVIYTQQEQQSCKS